jgi:hypothetical protein
VKREMERVRVRVRKGFILTNFVSYFKGIYTIKC